MGGEELDFLRAGHVVVKLGDPRYPVVMMWLTVAEEPEPMA